MSKQHSAVEKLESKNASLLGQYCEQSTCAGVVDWYSAESFPARFFWLVIVVAAVIGTAIQTINSIAAYATGNDALKTVISASIMINEPFPDITICNFNRINVTRMRQMGIDPALFEAAFATTTVSYPIPSTPMERLTPESGGVNFSEMLQEPIFAKWQAFVDSDYQRNNYQNLLHELGHDCQPTLVKMLYSIFTIMDPCVNYTEEIITNYGRCFVVKASEYQIIMAGSSMGMKLILNPALHQYLKAPIVNNYLESGFVLQIGQAREIVLQDPIALRPGTHSFISMVATTQKYQKERVAMFQLPCRDDAELSYMGGDYTKRMCHFDQLLAYAADHCDCSLALTRKRDDHICSVNETFSCFFPQLYNIPEERRLALSEICLDPCDGFTSIVPTTTSTIIATENFMEPLKTVWKERGLDFDCSNNTELDDCIRNIIAVDIFFSNIESVVTTTSEAQPLLDFIGNIGGQLGLWSGMCIMTLIQAAYYVILVFINKSKGRSQKHTVNNLTPAKPHVIW